MINFPIPKSFTFLPILKTFSATFNVAPFLGQYNFTVAANTGVELLTLDQSSVYLIETINIGASIAQETFYSAVGANAFPKMNPRYSIRNSQIYPLPIPIVNYVSNQQVAAWVWGEQGGEKVVIDFTGLLDQPASLVGVTTIQFGVQFNIYQITDTSFVNNFKSDNSNAMTGVPSRPIKKPVSFWA